MAITAKVNENKLLITNFQNDDDESINSNYSFYFNVYTEYVK